MIDCNLIFLHYQKNPQDERLRGMLDSLQEGNGFYLPKKDQCIQLIKDLEYFMSSYSEKDIENINRDLNIALHGEHPSYIPYQRPQLKIPPKRVKYSGFIYFLQDDLKRVKIGKTNNLDKRIFDIGIKLPVCPILFHSIKTSDITTIEQYFHKKYKNCRLEGEWFNLPQSELDEIKQIETLEV